MANDEGVPRFGPRTAASVEKCRQARWKHGQRSAAAVAERKAKVRATRRLLLDLHAIERELSLTFSFERWEG